MGVVYAEKESDVRSELRTSILESASGGSPQKPWHLVESVAENPDYSEADTRKALEEMMLQLYDLGMAGLLLVILTADVLFTLEVVTSPLV